MYTNVNKYPVTEEVHGLEIKNKLEKYLDN